MTTTTPSSLAYQREINIARERGVSPEGIEDCLRCSADENLSPTELRARLREYEPSSAEIAEREAA